MSMEIKILLQSFKRFIDQRKPKEAKDFSENIGKYFEQNHLTDSEIDCALEAVFEPSKGTIKFLKNAIDCKKLFKDSNIEILQLYRQLLAKYKHRCLVYSKSIVNCLSLYINSSQVSAKEKERSVLVIYDIVVLQSDDCSSEIIDLLKQLFNVFNQKDVKSRFLQHVFELTGLLSKKFPHLMNEGYSVKYRDVILLTLEKQLLKQENLSFTTVAGALQGLNDHFMNFAPSPTTDALLCDRVYVCVKKLSEPGLVKEKAAFKNAMLFLTSHSSLFSQNLFNDYIYWQFMLNKWLKWDIDIGMAATDAFHKEIATSIESRNCPNDVDILRNFVEHFKKTLQSSKSTACEIRIAIRGFGLMAKICKQHFPTKYLSDLLTLIIQRSEHLCMRGGVVSQRTDALEHLPDFIQALSEIMSQIRDLSNIQITSLQNIVIILMTNFPFLAKRHHKLVIISLLTTFYNIFQLSGDTLDSFMEKVIRQSIIWTCSCKLGVDVWVDGQSSTDWKDNITYKAYLPLWNGLLDGNNANNISGRQFMSRKVFEHTMNAFFFILDKLNLDTTKRKFSSTAAGAQDEFYYFCDPNIDLEPVKPKDFHLFFNLIDFYKDLLKAKPIEWYRLYFNDWISTMLECMIRKSYQHPLVSGFIKIIETVLKIGAELNLFENACDELASMDHKITSFVKRIISRTANTAGELQISFIRVIFAAPIQVLENVTLELVPIFLIAFDIASSAVWMGHLALTSLEKLTWHLSSEVIRDEFLRKTLPCLDMFLMNKTLDDKLRTEVSISKTTKRRIVKKNFTAGSQDNEWLVFQKRIMSYVGKLEPQKCLYIIKPHLKESDNLVKWDAQNELNLVLQCNHMQPIIHMDNFIPRVCELATSSTDRNVKISACEFLHATTLYLIGTEKSSGAVWIEVCAKILLLGCDIDATVQQMFEPLLLQMCHYLSHPTRMLTNGSELFLESLICAITQNNNSNVRDLAGRCLREFLQWSLRQVSTNQSSSSNLKIIFPKLKLLTFDSDANQRAGAALIFNNTYRIIREDEELLTIYSLELFDKFCLNFIMSEEFDDDTMNNFNLEQTSMCLDHLMRIFLVRKSLFLKPSKDRLVPMNFGSRENDGGTLIYVQQFLFLQCGSKQPKYRKKCMCMFTELALSFDGITGAIGSANDYLEQNFTTYQILKVFEGSTNGIASKPRILCTDSNPLLSICSWLEHFLVTLDCYTWLLNEEAGSSKLVENLLEKSSLLNVITYYLNEVNYKIMYELINNINSNYFNESKESAVNFGADLYEIERINRMKCEVLFKIIEFLTRVLIKNKSSYIDAAFWRQNTDVISTILIDLLYQSQTLNVTCNTAPQKLELERKIDGFFNSILSNSSIMLLTLKESIVDKVIADFNERLNRVVSSTAEGLFAAPVTAEKTTEIDGLELFSRLFVPKLTDAYISPTIRADMDVSAGKLLLQLFSSLSEQKSQAAYLIHFPPTIKTFANSLLKVALNLNDLMEAVITCIIHQQKVKIHFEESTFITKGEYFIQVYKRTVFSNFSKAHRKCVNVLVEKSTASNIFHLLRVLIDFFDYFYKHNKHNSDLLLDLANHTMRYWSTLYVHVKSATDTLDALHAKQQQDFQLIELLQQVVLMYPNGKDAIGEQAVGLKKWIVDLIASATSSVEILIRALTFLPCIVSSDTIEDVELMEALRTFQSVRIPLNSTEYPEESLERTTLLAIIRSLLQALVSSKSAIILKFLIHVTCADAKHIIEHEIRSCLASFIRSLAAEQQLLCLSMCFDFYLDMSLDPDIRTTILKRFVKSLLKNCEEEQAKFFYEKYIKRICELCESNYVGFNGLEVDALTSRCGGYELIEVYAGLFTKESLNNPDCIVARALLAKTCNEVVPGNKAIQDFCRRAYKIRTEILVSNDTKTEELFRQFNCAAYAALCALICSTQVKIDFYTILFKEHAPKNEFIWKKIINLKDDNFYNPAYFQLDEYHKIRHSIVSIRRSPNAAPNFLPGQQSPKYIQSQQICDSSLTDDVKNLDMNHVIVRSDADVLAKISNPVQNNVQITLKKSRINEHEVMPIICGVIKHMFENKITPIPEFETINTPAPAWVSEICAVIEDERQENYVRLFLVTVIYNTKEFMKHYASTVTASILKLIADGCAGSILNQFIIDLIVMLLSWNEKYVPSNPADRSYASSVLTFLMQHAYNEQKDLFKLNLELIKVYIELWKSVIIVPMQLLYDLLNRSTRFDSRDNICGLQLNSIVLANALLPWTDQTKDVFLQAVLICLENDYDIVYKPASELMGMCLQQLDPNSDDDLLDRVTAKLFAFKKKDENKFRSTLYGLHKHYPTIVDPFLTIVSGNISTAVGAFKRVYLELFLTRIEVLGDKIYREISMFGINNLLKQYEYQILALHIVNKALPYMKSNEISALLKEISNFVDINRNDCRDLMFEILMYIRNKNQQDEQDIKTVNQILLRGLASDTDNDISNRIFNFWSSNDQILSQSIEKRFTDLMTHMYDTKCESRFISICTQYLLEIPINNPNSKRQICQHQTNVGIKLTEYQLDTTFRRFNSRATPLFVESQQKNLLVGEGSQQMHHVLKQTQAIEGGGLFEPTQDPKSITQTSNTFTLQTQNSLLFTTASLTLDRRSQKSATHETDDKSVTNKILEKLERGNLKKIYHRQSGPTSQAKNQEKITLYRRYRYGDYPDLLINGLALLMPLQGLVKRDNKLARMVFVELFRTVLTELDATTLSSVLVEMNTCIQRIISQTVNCDYTLYATIMELSIMHAQHIDLQPDVVADTANVSNMIIMGVLYLEKKLTLLEIDVEPPSSKMSKTTSTDSTSVPIEEFCWYKLSELYSNLSETDMSSGILTDKLNFCSSISKAEALESDGDFLAAYREYRKIVQSESFTSTIEQNFCYQSYYDSLVKMGMWAELCETVQKDVDNYEEFWTDEFNQQHLLPHLIRSELRLILYGQGGTNVDFLHLLDSWLLDPEKSEFIKMNYGEELTMLYIAHGDFKTARVYSENMLRFFFTEWEKLNVLSDKVRSDKLLTVRKVAEIHNCSRYLLNEPTINLEADLTALCNAWSKSALDDSDSVTLWDSIVVSRHYIALTLANRLSSSPAAANLYQSVIDTSFKLLEVAIAQKNVMFSEKLISRVSAMCDRPVRAESQLLKLRLEILTSKLQIVKAGRESAARSQNSLISAWTKLQSIVDSEESPLALGLKVRCYEELSTIGKKLFMSGTEFGIDEEIQPRIFSLATSINSDSLFETIYNYSLWCLNKAMNLTQSVENEDEVDTKLVGNIFFKISQFRYELYNKEKVAQTDEIDTQIIFSTLRAMRFGNLNAKQFFPCILQLEGLSDNTAVQSVFEAEAEHVSEWMFLSWIPQILSHFDFNSVGYLDQLLCRLTKVYPNAMIYPFCLSLHQHQQLDVLKNSVKREGVVDIMKNFNNQTVYQFIDAISYVCLPHIMLHHHVYKLKKRMNKEMDIKTFRILLQGVLDVVYENNIQGSELESIRKYKPKLARLLKVNERTEISEVIFEILRDCEGMRRHYNHKHIHTKKLLPWLTNYQWRGKDQFLEIPGQYNHLEHRPDVDNHIKVVKFGHYLQLYESKRMPLKLSIYGSDGKVYSFLIKYGEDLRQDQRIQQLLHIMNALLLQNKECKVQNLYITTYKIEPLSGYVGLLSFVSDTVSVDGFLESYFKKKNVDYLALKLGITRKYKTFLRKNNTATESDVNLHGKAVVQFSASQIRSNYHELANMIDPFSLRSALFDIALTPECFFTLRNNFAKSLSAMNISHWLLGIGDRHLLNVLLNVKNGRVIGIDFNLCFGAASRDLPVPELMPFRLTPQFVNVMNPMQVSGIITKCMTHSLRCFRNSKKLLKACMEVFVKEPAIDWLDAAKDCHRKRTGDDDVELVVADWNPTLRIELASEKLNGVNPKKVLTTELSIGAVSASSDYLKGYLRVVNGDPQHNKRAKVADDNLSVEEQVASLIDLASDPVVLGITYTGWSPWI